MADFVFQTALLWGVSGDAVYEHWPAGTYGMNEPLGLAAGMGRGLTDREFWDAIGNAVGFWSRLPVLPWVADLVAYAESNADEWYVVTSPSRCPRCVPEKQEWCDRVLGDGTHFDRMIPTRYKHLLAKPGAVLVDDYDANRAAFEAAGGRCVLFPAHHNLRYNHKADPMTTVVGELETYRETL
ncbi:MAG: hypothetical protein ACRC7O_06145 [Fimbriiglobus sp.]